MTAKTGRMYNPQEPFLIVQSLIILKVVLICETDIVNATN